MFAYPLPVIYGYEHDGFRETPEFRRGKNDYLAKTQQ
jgi:hypothetical protein